MDTVKIKKSALLARINRQIKKEDKRLYKTRTETQRADLGEYYVLDTERNLIALKQIQDLEQYARERDYLKNFEAIMED